jgi:hypothetical protein
MKIGTEMVAIAVVSIEDREFVHVRVHRSKNKVLCKVDYEGMSDNDITRCDSTSWTDEHLDENALQHAERHVYGYLGVA